MSQDPAEPDVVEPVAKPSVIRTALPGVPLQKGYNGATRLLAGIEVGKSALFEDTTVYRISSLCSQLNRRFGWKFRCRTTNDRKSVKVYRVK